MPPQTMKSIKAEAKTIATKLRLDDRFLGRVKSGKFFWGGPKKYLRTPGLHDRIKHFPKREAFININDHKPNFPNNIKCQLINPAKSEVGKISKTLLDQINSAIRSKSNLNQLQNTEETIDWFTEIPQKRTCRYLKFDVTEY